MHPVAATDPNPQPRIEVAAGLVFRRGKLLITQRCPEAHQGGLWEFPGGKREANESFEACLARELREELGIEIAVGPLVESLTHAYPEKTVFLRFYRCRWLEHEPRPIGCADFKWVTAETVANYAFPAADARLLKKLARMFPKPSRRTPGRSRGNCSRQRR
jgi:mutator protein MutT